MRKTNKEWHKNHRMPKNPTLQDRLKWHIEHQKYCHCRPIPHDLINLMNK